MNYGVFTKYTERVTDIVVWNEGTNTDHLLRADFSPNFQVLYSTKDVQPGDSLVIRIKFNPRKSVWLAVRERRTLFSIVS